ncbi:MAG: alpha/beta hydrolase [Pseudomonadota bacterium]
MSRVARPVVGDTSWGDLVASHAARAAPDLVSAALLINTPLEHGAGASFMQRFIAAGARWAPGLGVFRQGVARSFFADPSLADSPDYRAAFHAMLKAADGRAMGPVVRAVLLDAPPLRPLLPGITVPTLMIAGREDGMYPAQGLRGGSHAAQGALCGSARSPHIGRRRPLRDAASDIGCPAIPPRLSTAQETGGAPTRCRSRDRMPMYSANIQ